MGLVCNIDEGATTGDIVVENVAPVHARRSYIAPAPVVTKVVEPTTVVAPATTFTRPLVGSYVPTFAHLAPTTTVTTVPDEADDTTE